MKPEKIEDPKLANDIRALGAEAPRAPQKAAETRAAFISEAWKLRQAVSAARPERHKIWKNKFTPILVKPRREGFSMMNVALLVVMVLGLVFGGGGITVSAAQSSMPDDALYAVKLASEQVRMQLAGDTEAEFQLALQFANRRMDEAGYMLANSEMPDEALMARIQVQNENCLRLAVGMPEDKAVQALIMVQEQLRQQLQKMEQLNLPDDAALEALQLRLRTMLQTQLQLALLGEGDQLKLKEQLQIREQQRLEQQENDAQQNQNQNQDGSGSGGSNGSPWQGDASTGGNGSGSGGAQNPWTTGTPTPGSGYGDGESQNPWTTDTPTPGSGYGPGESQNPWTTETPTPGSGYGPGSGDCTTCMPQYGTPGGSGGNQP